MARRRISNPYEAVSHKTERTAAAKLAEAMNQIIREENLPLGGAEVETGGSDTKFPDVVLHTSPSSSDVLVVFEAKPPAYNPLNEDELKEPARRKATERKARFFCTTNFKELWCFITEEVNKMAEPARQVFQRYRLSGLEDLNKIDEPAVRSSIYRALRQFLLDLTETVKGERPAPRLPIDQLLVSELQASINTLAGYYRYLISQKCASDVRFRKQLSSWFADQGWTFTAQDPDYERAARQTAYLLVNKLLFYSAIQPVRRLSPLEIPVSLRSGATLHSFLQGYFDEVLRIDYETIYTTDFIDQLAFPDDASIVEEVKRLVQLVARHDFSTLGYDVIGRIFEQLIPPDERHLLGEYYTEPDVVDLILRFCLKHENNTVFDPSCGAGTFLVRAYLQKKLMNQRLEHERIIASLWGNDIAKFPVHLATINLAINDLRCNENFPNIVQNDFFDLVPEADIFPTRRQEGKMKVKGLGGAGRLVRHPRQFDCIVGNPPYTRAEEIGEMKGGERYYREAVAEKALKNGSGSAIARLSGRSGIHSYFFVHGGKFLQEGGWFAFVVTDTWMDAGYGAGLQEYFLNNFKIVAIVESKVERWFSDADVNTCIVVLQKASSKDRERKGNTVRFVYLLKPLSHFIPQAQGTWASQVARRDAVDNLVRTILSHSSYYENEELRICPRNQGELEETGWDKEREEYVGSKWGRHIRGAAILNRILEKAASSLVRLSSVAAVCRGFTTGADPWFYVQPVQPVEHSPGSDAKSVSKGLREVRSGDGTVWAVEDEFLKQVLKSPEKYPCIRVDAAEVNDLVIRVPAGHRPLRKSGISRYIKHGETVSYRMGKERSMVPAETKTCSGRAQWYVLPEVPATRLHWQKTFDRYYRHHCTAEPMLSNQRFYQIQARREEDEIPICFSINSSFTALWLESQRAALGLGALEATVEEVESALVLDPAKLSRRDRNRISHVFERCSTERPADITALGTSECRASMDELFLELAGFADHVERKEVLGQLQAALRDMASDRFARAKSTNKKANHVSVDVGQLVKDIELELGGDDLGSFYRLQVLALEGGERTLPSFPGEPEVVHSLYGWRLQKGRVEAECRDENEARFLQVFATAGFREVHVPLGEKDMAEAVRVLDELFPRVKNALLGATSSITQKKLRDQVIRRFWSSVRQSAQNG